jgi:hypothetical protein
LSFIQLGCEGSENNHRIVPSKAKWIWDSCNEMKGGGETYHHTIYALILTYITKILHLYMCTRALFDHLNVQ